MCVTRLENIWYSLVALTLFGVIIIMAACPVDSNLDIDWPDLDITTIVRDHAGGVMNVSM